jgi:hypothetical protein
LNGIHGILAAGGVIAAVATEEMAEGNAVEEDEMDEEPTH